MKQERGTVSVQSENIFPIIRKWLYSDRDIFLRELVSNAADAIAKLRRLVAIGEASIDDSQPMSIRVVFDQDARTLTVTDDGIGMTADEIKKYINQIAFSGVLDFVERYRDKGVEADGIIGHFGLGFYSAFMVADKVRIDTRSYLPDAPAASWESEDGLAYVMGPSDYQPRGTQITISLSDEGMGFLTGDVLLETLEKYCGFMADPIYFTDVQADATRRKEEEQARQAAKEADPDAADPLDDEEKEAEPINDTQPLWLKNPSDCTDEEYKAFYKKTFRDFRDPLFWVHLNLDYPFRLKGILYFPKLDHAYESLEGRIKIYYNQVFVADNIKEIIPEFLFLLKGTLDCPDLPLNVSRSFLQNDATVSKLSKHIIRKVSDRLKHLFKDERETFESYWQDIGVFVKYGMIRDENFYERVKELALFETVDQGYKTIDDLGETIYYTPDPKQQVAYIHMIREKDQTVVVMDHELDNHFMSFIEFKNPKKKFQRVDAQLEGTASDSSHTDQLTALFRAVSGQDKLLVKIQRLGPDALPALLVESESSRRMQEMQRQFQVMQGGGGADLDELFAAELTLVINDDRPLTSRLAALASLPDKEEEARDLALQVYDLARLGHGSLTADDMALFLKRSSKLLEEQAQA